MAKQPSAPLGDGWNWAPGDKCVSLTTWEHLRHKCGIVRGRVYVVTRVNPPTGRIHGVCLIFSDPSTRSPSLPTHAGGWRAKHFRKLLPATDDFVERLRSLKSPDRVHSQALED